MRRSKKAQAAAAHNKGSPLLQCLSQLDVDTWATVLLPKLVEHGSSGDVALTCSQLRDLCRNSITRLDLQCLTTTSSGNPGLIEQWAADLDQRFPSCSSVDLLLEKEGDYLGAPFVLTALAKLPKLNSISIIVQHTLHAGRLSTMLYLMRTQLPSLGSLSIDVMTENFNKQYTDPLWEQLGKITQLTHLQLQFGEDVLEPWNAPRLTELFRLNRLSSLGLVAAGCLEDRDPDRWAFVKALTALTSLDISVAFSQELCKLSRCVGLQQLVVKSPDRYAESLNLDAWTALGHLTRLTELQLWVADCVETFPEFMSAITRLSRLEVIAARVWAPGVLPTLKALPNLTDILGEWDEDEEEGFDVEGVTLTQVRTLNAAQGSVPFSAFPNLEEFGQSGRLHAECMLNVGSSCPKLRDWWMEGLVGASLYSVSSGQTELQGRVAAIQSLTALKHLTRLEFAPQDSAEVIAFVATAESLLKGAGLKQVRVQVKCPWTCSRVPFMQLARLAGLWELHLEMQGFINL